MLTEGRPRGLGSSESSASPALRIAIQKIARDTSSRAAIESVMAVAAPTDFVRRRQSRSTPVSNNSSTPSSASSAAKRRSRMRWRARSRSSRTRHRRQRLVGRGADHERVRTQLEATWRRRAPGSGPRWRANSPRSPPARSGRARDDARSETLRRAERGDAGAQRQLFDQVAASGARTDVAVTIYGAANQPRRLARPIRERARRPALRTGVDVPGAEQPGPAAGPRPADHRSGGAARNHRRDRRRSAAAAHRQTRRCPARSFRSKPASCRSRCGCSSKAPRMPVRMRSSSARRPDEPLAAVIVSDADLQRARQRIRDRLYAAELALAACSCCCSPGRCSTGAG